MPHTCTANNILHSKAQNTPSQDNQGKVQTYCIHVHNVKDMLVQSSLRRGKDEDSTRSRDVGTSQPSTQDNQRSKMPYRYSKREKTCLSNQLGKRKTKTVREEPDQSNTKHEKLPHQHTSNPSIHAAQTRNWTDRCKGKIKGTVSLSTTVKRTARPTRPEKRKTRGQNKNLLWSKNTQDTGDQGEDQKHCIHIHNLKYMLVQPHRRGKHENRIRRERTHKIHGQEKQTLHHIKSNNASYRSYARHFQVRILSQQR
ncbi:hypothetical protein BJ508DRAFT_315375 [Ascobolus immersus RN42]|uniref:Uncharacterized protein n=1 Tax=Ascobolus immersus RN42 TaxID=1160509 RepID=A0A3N4HPU7_ASCIM|nr:hypothetical protein BJ508DRAFT_315375 [Ascobolus immersus RN42]